MVDDLVGHGEMIHVGKGLLTGDLRGNQFRLTHVEIEKGQEDRLQRAEESKG